MAKEIFTTAGVMWVLTLTGLAVGFGLLKLQGYTQKENLQSTHICVEITRYILYIDILKS